MYRCVSFPIDLRMNHNNKQEKLTFPEKIEATLEERVSTLKRIEYDKDAHLKGTGSHGSMSLNGV